MSLLLAVAQAVLAVGTVPAATGVVDYPTAYFEAAHPTSARDMLDRIPGFTFDGGVSVRGYEGAAGNVLVDGQRPAAKTDTLDAILRRIPTTSVARIEIIRGGASGVDMQGQSVLANVVLKRDTSRTLQISSGATYLTSSGLIVSQVRLVGTGQGNGRKWDFSLLAGKYIDGSYGTGPTLRTNGKGVTTQTGYSQSKAVGGTYQATGAYETAFAGGRLKVNGLILSAPYDDDISNRTLTPLNALEREHVSIDADSSELGIRFSRPLGAQSSMEFVALRQAKDTEFSDRVRNPSTIIDFDQRSKTAENILRGVFKQKLSPTVAWEFGLEGAQNTLRNRLTYSENGQKITLPSANVTVTENRYEAIAKASWSPNRQWTVETDIRQELSDIASEGDTVLSKSLSYTKPRLAVKWSYADGNQIRLRLEQEVGQLNFSDFTASSALKNGLVTAGNPSLVPEQSWVTEITSEHQVLKRGAVLVTGRHIQLSNVIDRAPIFTATGAIDSPANIGSGTKDEVAINATLPLDSFGAKGIQIQSNVTWRRSRVTDPTTHAERSISGLPDKVWDASLTWDLPERNLNLTLVLAEEMKSTNYRFNQVETLKVGSYLRFVAVWTPDPKTLVRIDMYNLTRQPISYRNDVFSGARSNSGLLYRDYRQESLGKFIAIGVRRSF